MRPVILKEICSKCGQCVKVCPMDVLGKDKDNNIILTNKSDCVGCRACEFHCPKECIKIID